MSTGPPLADGNIRPAFRKQGIAQCGEGVGGAWNGCEKVDDVILFLPDQPAADGLVLARIDGAAEAILPCADHQREIIRQQGGEG